MHYLKSIAATVKNRKSHNGTPIQLQLKFHTFPKPFANIQLAFVYLP